MPEKRIALWCTLCCLLAARPGPAQESPTDAEPRRVVTIAVVRDGPCAYFSNLFEHVRTELDVLAGEEWDIRWKDDPGYDANWEASRVEAALQKALADDGVDLVFLSGILVTEHAARGAFDLARPVISGFVQDPDAVGMPYNEEGYSTRTNFNFVVVPLRSARDIEEFRELAAFDRLTVLVDRTLLDGIPELEPEIQRFAREFGAVFRVVPLGLRADEALNQLGPDDRAVYLTPAMRMEEPEWQRLLDGLNERGILSFSLMGHEDVRRGALAGLAPDISIRLARRLALNMEQVLRGTPPEDLPVRMDVEEKLMINARTAAKIGFYPPFRVLQRAEILYRDEFPLGDTLTLDTAMQLAAANNIDLAVKTEETEVAREDRNKALTTLFPQASANARHYRVDSDRAEASGGLQPEDASLGGVSITQLVFSDPALAAYRSLKRLHRVKEFEREALRLDVALEAGRAFLDYLSARAVYRIEMDNLDLTRRNLDLARVRHGAGTSGPEEIYRWEAELAKRQGAVANAEATMLKALAALNQSMGAPIDKTWDPREISAGDAAYYYLGPEFNDLISNERNYNILMRTVQEGALRDSPELQAVDLAIEAQRIQLAQLRRRPLVPDIGLQFAYDHTFDETIAGPTLAAGPAADDDEWTASVQATWPFFSGGGEAVEAARARAELRRLQNVRAQTAQLIEQRAYTAMYATWGSSPNIRLTRLAAEAAAKNLAVIQDKYARGAVSILDLLDAQNQAFLQNQDAELAVYQFVSDVMGVQRAMASLGALSTAGERAAWIEHLKRQIEEPTEQGGKP
ncbi:MAG: TolC family protein [Kiritimatiellae bacterium]|nr:TolC family protein [Kiritimatiellia bacterium]